jgi:MoxR-like ATPase
VTAAPDAMHITAIRDRVRERLVGREHELDLVLAAVAAGRDIVLEGPPGTSKSTLHRDEVVYVQPAPAGDPAKGAL